MNKKLNLIAVMIVFWAACLVCNGDTHTPWDGTAWDTASPDIDQLIGNHYKELYDLRKGVGIRMDKEHETLATSSAGGVHKQGSARAFWQDAAPTTQIDGSAWDSGDTGSLWFDTNATPDNLFYVLTDSSGDGTWTKISVSLVAEIIAAAHSWADVQTFDLQTVHTLGILSNDDITLGAGDDLVGSATSNILINTNKFTVAGDTGNTLVAGTLDVSGNIDPTAYETTNGGFLNNDTMTGAADNIVASSDSIVKYVVLDGNGVLMHDSPGGGFQNNDVNGTRTKVYTKYLTGNLDADGQTSVAHGVTAPLAKILNVTVNCSNDGGGGSVANVLCGDYKEGDDANTGFSYHYDGTNIIITGAGAYLQGNPYRIKIDFIL